MRQSPEVRSTVHCVALLLAAISVMAQGGAAAPVGDGAGPPRVAAPQSTIHAPNGAAGDTFGRRVAMSGDRLIVGANGVDRGGVPDVGAAYVYRRAGAAWTHEATLQPEATTVPLFFGWSVAIEGDIAVVGSLGDNTGGLVNRGAAYVFVRTGTTWAQHSKLVMPDGQASDEAGVSVAIGGGGDYIFMGAPYHDVGGVADAGAVQVFVRGSVGTTFGWGAGVKLVAPAAQSPVPNFGRSLAVQDQTLIVGSSPDAMFSPDVSTSGAAHVFVRTAVVWAHQAELRPNSSSGGVPTQVGASVALDGETAAVGAPGTYRSGQSAYGSAHIFGRSGTTWTWHQEVGRVQARAFERYGASVVIAGDMTVVGAPGTTGDPGGERGFVTIHVRLGSVWPNGVALLSADLQTGDHFGASLAMSGGLLAVGVPNDDVGPNADQGSVRVFDLALLDTDEDGLPDAWERQYGLDPQSAAGVDGGAGDPDGDGRTNLQEYQADTHPRNVAALTRYLAEGASTAFFDTRIALVNPGTGTATVLLRFLKSDGSIATRSMQIPALRRQSILVDTLASMANAEFSTVVETDALVVVDRTMWWDSTAYGTHAETALEAPGTTWYLAEGATHSGFNLFYLVQNATATAASVQVSYLLPAGAPIVKSYTVPANSRFNIWVNREGAALASTDVSAVVTSTNDVPVIVERAMYLDAAGQAFGAGHESAGVRAPATDWYLAEGATGDYFDLFVLIANPGTTAAAVQARYLLPNGTTITKTYTVPASSRFNIWVDFEDPALANTAVSTVISSTNGVPLIVERAMWWPGPRAATWQEAHNSAGATVTGAAWAMADGETGGPANVSTYVLVANTGPAAGTVRVTLLFDSIIPLSRDFPIAGNSRFNVDIRAEFPFGGVSRSYGVMVESLGASPAPIVVERAMYSDARGVTWAAGTNVLATRLR